MTFDSIEIVKWVAKSMHPFSMVEDPGFKTLMKTRRPKHYLPSRFTIARDVKHVFKKTRKSIAMMLQVSQYRKPELNPQKMISSGIWGKTELRHGCVDLAQQQGICGGDSSLRAVGWANVPPSQHCRAGEITFRHQSRQGLCWYLERLWDFTQG